MKPKMEKASTGQSGMTRREIIGTVAAATAFTIVPSHVLGGKGKTAPKEFSMKVSMPREDYPTIRIDAGEGRTWAIMAPEFITSKEMHIFVHPYGVYGPGRDSKVKFTKSRTDKGWRSNQDFMEDRVSTECVTSSKDEESVELLCTIENNRKETLRNTIADFCFSHGSHHETSLESIRGRTVNTTFSGPVKEANTDWTRRTVVPTRSGLKVVGDKNIYFPVAINPNMHLGQNMVNIPIILCQSVDYTETYAAGWEDLYAVYCAIGSCIHTLVDFGNIEPGEKVTRKGWFYYMKKDVYQVLLRFQEDLMG